MKKKMLSVLLAVCMLAAMLTTSMVAFAADAQAFKVDVQAAGKTVTVTITLPCTGKRQHGQPQLQRKCSAFLVCTAFGDHHRHGDVENGVHVKERHRFSE